VERLKLIAVIAGLIGFVAMLLGIAWADRVAKREIAQGREPRFSWAWFIFSLYLLAQGASSVLNAWVYEKYAAQGFWSDFIWKTLSAILLGVAIPNFLNHVRWLIYSRRQTKE
jgi:hypothetical protein